MVAAIWAVRPAAALRLVINNGGGRFGASFDSVRGTAQHCRLALVPSLGRSYPSNKCASVYGCQGFDLDFAGLFWGRDLAVRVQGIRVVFELSDLSDVTDDIGVAYGRKLVRLVADAKHDPRLRDLVVEGLKNRYRILLSRARKGIFIHCEDLETQRSLETILQR